MTYSLLTGADDDVAGWVFARIQSEPWVRGSGHAIGWTRDNKLVAGVTYSSFNGQNVWMAIASEDSRWINRASLWAIFHYPFIQLKVKRISVLIDASNARSIEFVKRLGLSHEATLVDSAPDGDQLVYRLFASECKWLNDLRFHREDKAEAA